MLQTTFSLSQATLRKKRSARVTDKELLTRPLVKVQVRCASVLGFIVACILSACHAGTDLQRALGARGREKHVTVLTGARVHPSA